MSLTKLVYMGRAVLAQQRDVCRILQADAASEVGPWPRPVGDRPVIP